MTPRHRPILEQIVTPWGTLIREDYYLHPQGISNIYLVDADGRFRWEAELPWFADTFPGPLSVTGDEFSCASWHGTLCKFSLKTGRILNREFVK